MLPIHSLDYLKFQHTTARRRLLASTAGRISETSVSTHNRPKAAAVTEQRLQDALIVSTHNRPKAAAPIVVRF